MGQGFCYCLIWALEALGPKDPAPPHLSSQTESSPLLPFFYSLHLLPYKQGWSSHLFP